MSRGWIAGLIAAVAALGLVVIGGIAFVAFIVLPALRSASVAPEAQRAMIDRPAPPVTMATLDGATWSLADQRGKTVVLHFWASWCGPCKRQMPYLRAVRERYGDRDDFTVVGVNIDESTEAARAAVQSEGLTWTQLHEPGAAWDVAPVRDYNVRGIPSILLVGPGGDVRAVGLRNDGIEAAVERTVDGA